MGLWFNKNELIHVCFTSKLKKFVAYCVFLALFSAAGLQCDLLFQRYSWFYYHPIIPKIMLAYWPHPYTVPSSEFLKILDKQLQDVAFEQTPEPLAKFVSVAIDKMFIKEELFVINILEHFVGYSDIRDMKNLLADYDTKYRESGRTPRPLVK